MSAPKVVINYHIKRLQDKSPQVRLEAIEELRKIASPDALEPLQAVFNDDDDVDVKRAAQQAGREIWSNQQKSET